MKTTNLCAIALAVAGASVFSACGGGAPEAPTGVAAPVVVATSASASTRPPSAEATATPSSAAIAPSATPTASLAPTDVPRGSTDARALIGNAANKWYSSGPIKMRITSSEPSAPAAEMFIVPPDQSRFVQTLSDGSHFETIKIGSANYSFVNGEWKASSSEATPLDKPLWTDPAALNDIQNIQALGTQEINGIGATGFSFTDVSDPGTLNTMWIGPNGAPLQVIAASVAETVTFDIEYDASIKIAAPL